MSLFPQQDTLEANKNTAESFVFIDSLSSVNNDTLFSHDSISTDSVILVQDTTKQTQIKQPSLFSTHQLKVNDASPTAKSYINNDWITIHLIICVILLGWSRIYFGKRFNQILKAFFSIRQMNTLIREGNIFRERISIPLLINYLVSFSLLIYIALVELLQDSIFDLSGIQLFSVIILFVLISWFVKNIVINIVGIVFKNATVISDYVYTNFVFNIFIGLILIPVVITAIYLPALEVVYAGIAIWFLIYFYKLVRELFSGLSLSEFSLFYRILYLCTLEIVPLLVLIKLTMSYLD